MKGLAGLGAAACIAGAVALWFMTRPTLVVIEARPLTPSSALPTFHQVTDNPQFVPEPRKAR
jgi:hypothetical protein